MPREKHPKIFFFPGIGCEVIDLFGNPKFLRFDYSSSLSKDIASSLSKLTAGEKPKWKNQKIKNVSLKIFNQWKKSGGKIFEKNLIEKKISSPELSPLTFKNNHLTSNKKIDWKKIESFLKGKKFRIERRKENPLRKNSEYPCFIFVVKNGDSVISEGKSTSKSQAKKSAMAEAVERLLSKKPADERFLLRSQKDIFGELIHFESGSRDVFSQDLITEWIPAYNFSRKKWSWMPAEAAYMDYIPKNGIKAFCLHHTMGLAAGKSFEEAAMNGLLEVIERDAYWNVMRCRINCPDIKISQLSEKSRKLISSLEKQGLRIVLKNISLDWPINVAHATIINEKESLPAFSHGTGCAFSFKEAAEKALLESIQVYSGLAEIAKHEWSRIISVEGVLGNSRFAWTDPLIKPHINHLIEKGPVDKRNKKKIAKNISDLVKMLCIKDHEILSSNLGEEKGLVVVRTYLTGATHPDDRLERISKRLQNNIKTHCPKGAYWDPILI